MVAKHTFCIADLFYDQGWLSGAQHDDQRPWVAMS